MRSWDTFYVVHMFTFRTACSMHVGLASCMAYRHFIECCSSGVLSPDMRGHASHSRWLPGTLCQLLVQVRTTVLPLLFFSFACSTYTMKLRPASTPPSNTS